MFAFLCFIYPDENIIWGGEIIKVFNYLTGGGYIFLAFFVII